MRLDLLQRLNAARAARRPTILVTDTASGEQRLVESDAIGADPLADVLEPALRSGKSGPAEHAGRSYFLTVQAPPVRLVVIGAVHISQALAPMAKLAGFDMTIVDPRTAFASPERFPDVRVVAEWPDVALPPMNLDRYTAMCFFTHDPKIDDPGLVQALRAECFYIGALGSRKTHAARVARMHAHGFTPEQTRPHPRADRTRHRGCLAGRDRRLGAGRDHPVAAQEAAALGEAGPGACRLKFGPVPVAQSLGCIVAHAIRRDGIVLKKGDLVEAGHVAALRQAGIAEIVVARLEPGDIGEDAAAGLLANRIAGGHLRVDRAFTGRANLFAEVPGVFRVDIDAVRG